jgi:hypothetical protein
LSQDFKLPTETGTSTSGAPVLKKGLRLTTHACNHPGIWMKFVDQNPSLGLEKLSKTEIVLCLGGSMMVPGVKQPN